ncbi:PDR/VanB family oxidoreductase [Actinospica durhamensis]|uniref:PDR/VanB family oxidoreductase n=1 Tax=Actinospica durhamensis TaxID=1508375 RepID=UPI0027DBAB65|nr:PDR/VanB family oxidoreductase [Actinospica durhamensis]
MTQAEPGVQAADVKVVVTERVEAAVGVVSLTLGAVDGGALPPWSPGAHIDLHLREDLVRQYSLCGDPEDRAHWRIAVLRETGGRGGSVFVHDELAVGTALSVSAPRNNFALLPARRYLFIAGGIGITPLLPMIAQAHAEDAEWGLLYGGRTRGSMAFAKRLATRHGARVQVRPQDEHGLLDLAAHLAEPDEETLIYACGPEPMLAAVAAASAHWPSGALRVERFTPVEVGEPVRADAFDVVLARSGTRVTVRPGCSILETVEAAGVDVLSSCREGTCGTCETAVLAGVPEHRDSLLTPDERESNEIMFICVSRSLSPELTLDL